MSEQDLSKLRIDRGAANAHGTNARRSRRFIRWSIVAAAVAIAAYVGYLYRPAVQVETATVSQVYPSQALSALNATGYVVAQRKAAVASKATGRLEWLGVAEGSRVRAGDIIARLDSRDVAAQADSARANVVAARAALEQTQAEERDASSQLKRNQDLLAKGFVSAATMDTAKARAERAAAAVANARAAIVAAEANARNAQVAVDYTLIRAPFDGVILSKSANVGDMVTPFSSAADSKGAVVTMADMRTLEVEADVSESSLGKIQVGQPVEVTLDALPDTRLRGRISRIVPTVDRAKATVMTKVKFDAIDPRILPEMSAKVAFLSREVTAEQQKPLLAVNADAIATRGGRPVVFAVRDGRAVEVAVTPGAKIGDVTAIAGELKSGDKVVSKPGDDVAAGVLVKTATK